jgi:Cu/Ag efflux protein CusF
VGHCGVFDLSGGLNFGQNTAVAARGLTVYRTADDTPIHPTDSRKYPMKKQSLILAMAACLSLGAVGLMPVASADTTTPLAGAVTVSELTGEVVAINKETRQMTIRTPDGSFEVLDIPAEVKRNDHIEVGNKVAITETEAVLVDVEKGRDAGSMGSVEKTTVKPEAGTKPAGTITTKLKLYGKVESVDRAASQVTIRGPEKLVTLSVKDKAILDQLKPGDGVIATYVRTITGKVTFN